MHDDLQMQSIVCENRLNPHDTLRLKCKLIANVDSSVINSSLC